MQRRSFLGLTSFIPALPFLPKLKAKKKSPPVIAPEVDIQKIAANERKNRRFITIADGYGEPFHYDPISDMWRQNESDPWKPVNPRAT